MTRRSCDPSKKVLRLVDDHVVGQLHLGSHLAFWVVRHHDLHLKGLGFRV